MPTKARIFSILLCAGIGVGYAVLRQRLAESRLAIAPATEKLVDARRDFKSKLTRQDREDAPPDEPPEGMFKVVNYASPAGQLAAYLSLDPGDDKKHPAVIWIVGGFSNSIGAFAWHEAAPSNDQSASAFRKAGIMMMYPSFRGGNQNSGVKEAFLGEVDDVLASADFLAKQPGVDPNRIYLGGHSTGGTMVLLAAECSSRFRAVFSFGPMADVSSYGQEYLPFDVNDKTEVRLRSPGYWLESIECPTFVFTGTVQDNTTSVKWMMKYGKNPKVECHLVEGANHHSILAPLTKLVAEKILNDTGPSASFSFDDGQLNALFAN